MKKILSILLVLALTLVTVTACGSDETAESSSEQVNTSQISSITATSSEISSKETSTSAIKESSSSKKKPASKPQVSSKEEEVELTELEKIYYGVDPDLYTLGLKNKGDTSRIAALMKKAEKGGNYKIAVLGGSISQGASASSVYSSYGNLVCEWWAGAFPESNFEFINAGIGSTNPEMACYRIEADLLAFKPDFVVVDFNVNTYLDEDLYNTYSTILYKILSRKNSPAVMTIDFTNCDKTLYATGTYKKPSVFDNKQITKATLAYNISAVSYAKYVWNKIDAKILAWRLGGYEKKSGLSRDVGADYIHPNDTGHMVAANIITAFLKKVKDNLSKESTKITAPKKPENSSYINLKYVTNTAKGVTLSGGFKARSNETASTRGWDYNATAEASSLTIPVPANKAVKVFMKFNDGSSGEIKVTDGKTTKTISPANAKTPTLVDIGKMDGKITLTPNMQSGGFVIFGIGIKN